MCLLNCERPRVRAWYLGELANTLQCHEYPTCTPPWGAESNPVPVVWFVQHVICEALASTLGSLRLFLGAGMQLDAFILDIDGEGVGWLLMARPIWV